MGMDAYLEKRRKWSNKTTEIMYWRKCQDLNTLIIDEINAEVWNCCVDPTIMTLDMFNKIVWKADIILDEELYQNEIIRIKEEFNNLSQDEEIIYSSDW